MLASSFPILTGVRTLNQDCSDFIFIGIKIKLEIDCQVGKIRRVSKEKWGHPFLNEQTMGGGRRGNWMTKMETLKRANKKKMQKLGEGNWMAVVNIITSYKYRQTRNYSYKRTNILTEFYKTPH